MRLNFLLPLFVLLVWSFGALAQDCGQGGKCEIAEGYYLAALPSDWDGKTPLPLIVYYHGWNSSPEATFRNKAMIHAAHRRGALFVAPYAPTGYWRQIGPGRAEAGRDELLYSQTLMADIRRRWPIDDRQTLASGFSRGASMVWNLACYAGDLFAGFAPIAGAFWGELPRDCPTGPVSLRHIHGLSDRVVAFRERGIYNSAAVTDSMAFLQHQFSCSAMPHKQEAGAKLSCRRYPGCESGETLEICTHEGGHSIPAEWVAEGLDWLNRLSRPG